MNIEQEYDAVIVGAGAAGLSAALGLLEVADDNGEPLKLLVVSKLQPLRSHTGSAEGGIAASLGNEEADDWRWHYYDTVKGGDWLVDQDAAKLLAQEAKATLIDLERAGVAFSRRADGRISQRRFGGHTANYGGRPVKRAAYAADRIGHRILSSLWQQCLKHGVAFAEEWYVCDLALSDSGDEALGLVAWDERTGQVHAIRARKVILCTGGAGRLFHTSSNSYDLTGDGMSLALRAGLQLEDMEFVQFHPTGLGHTGILLSEASRAEGGVLRNAKGEAFMARYAPEHRDLAARDVVSRAIVAETDQGRGVADPREPQGPKDCVWLDLRAIPAQDMRDKLPQVDETIRRYAGLDPTRDLVPVKPTAHYMMGGLPIDLDGRIYRWNDGRRFPVAGLFAAGECACVGVHGANRLGGNSLLDACLFGRRAGRSAAQDILAERQSSSAAAPAQQPDSVQSDRLDLLASQRRRETAGLLDSATQTVDSAATPTTAGSANDGDASTDSNPYQLIESLGRLMDQAAAVRCDSDSLSSAQARLDGDLSSQVENLSLHDPSPNFNQELVAIFEVRNLTGLARAVLKSSLERQESRGSLSRLDFPRRDDEHYLQHSLIDADGHISWQPVHIQDFPPGSRSY